MKSELLQIEVELILLKHGEAAVLKALSTATGATEDQLQKKIKILQEKAAKPSRIPKEKKQPLDVAREIVVGSPDEDVLLRLAALYQNKQFLPQLKDVKRLLGRFNITKDVKTRIEATKLLFESLRACSRDELNEFITDIESGGQSSFAKLADHIMGTRDTKSSNN